MQLLVHSASKLEKNYKTNLTSPDIVTLHRNLEKLKRDKIDNVIIEVSSHGLDQKRLDGLKLRSAYLQTSAKIIWIIINYERLLKC